MNRFLTFVVMCALAAVPMAAQTPHKKIHVSVEQKATAREQLAHARALMHQAAAARQHHDIHVAVANAAGHLGVIERVWPNDREAVAEARTLLAQLYFDGKMTRNAAEAADQALADSPGDHRLHAISARAHARLGNKAQAALAFAKTLDTYEETRGTTGENLAALNAAAFFFEQEKQHDKAAAALRAASSLDDLTPMVRVTLRLRALEQSSRTVDRGAAMKDLAELRSARRVALGTTLTPEQREALNIAEAGIARFEKTLERTVK